jgi:hypothetical protein
MTGVEERLCPACGLTKRLTDFNRRDARRTRLQSYCRDCSNAAWRTWYADRSDRDRHLLQVSKRRRRRNARNQELILRLKAQPADCGRRFPPYVMDFDHVGEKRSEVSSFVRTRSTKTLLEEIRRCVLVCANCHRETHSQASHEGAGTVREQIRTAAQFAQLQCVGRGVAQPGERAAFGTPRSRVRIPPPRPPGLSSAGDPP